MDKTAIIQLITEQLTSDLAVQFKAAITAHEASTDSENIPDNKYETLALEASYVAQGQANRAQEIKRALETYKQLTLRQFDDDSSIRLTALVSLAGDDAANRTVFIGPLEGGMKIIDHLTGTEIVVITPASPLGKNLIGKTVGDMVMIGIDGKNFEIITVC
ncbi:MAG TPA: transcription elongation factor GreAB [Desulfuromonadales bacterium]|nr:transcription elongation factor GreAB [Desulfuromonadales bacterium]